MTLFEEGDRVRHFIVKKETGTFIGPSHINGWFMLTIKWDDGSTSTHFPSFIEPELGPGFCALIAAIESTPESEVHCFFIKKGITVWEDGSFQVKDDPICNDFSDWLSACAYLKAEGFIETGELVG